MGSEQKKIQVKSCQFNGKKIITLVCAKTGSGLNGYWVNMGSEQNEFGLKPVETKSG